MEDSVAAGVQKTLSKLLDGSLGPVVGRMVKSYHFGAQRMKELAVNSRDILSLDFFHYLHDGLPVWLRVVATAGFL